VIPLCCLPTIVGLRFSGCEVKLAWLLDRQIFAQKPQADQTMSSAKGPDGLFTAVEL
jgi:hypothetical protein